MNNCDAFQSFMQKEDITFVIFIDQTTNNGPLKFVTTSEDGFVKMNEIDLQKNIFNCRKAFFVCQSGISAAC